jgi:phenylalanyl-tRNA synthetase alpha chain
VCLRQTSTIDDVVQQKLSGFKNGEALSDKDKLVLSKRKLLRDVKTKVFDLTKGEHFSVTGIKKKALDLTAEMIASYNAPSLSVWVEGIADMRGGAICRGAWETETFKEYNFNALGTQPTSGHLHPLLKVRSAFREIFLEMGFEEMPTNSFVESSFWNFDALFQPQQHPARDAHDTFFLSQPASMLTWPEDYLQVGVSPLPLFHKSSS